MKMKQKNKKDKILGMLLADFSEILYQEMRHMHLMELSELMKEQLWWKEIFDATSSFD